MVQPGLTGATRLASGTMTVSGELRGVADMLHAAKTSFRAVAEGGQLIENHGGDT